MEVIQIQEISGADYTTQGCKNLCEAKMDDPLWLILLG